MTSSQEYLRALRLHYQLYHNTDEPHDFDNSPNWFPITSISLILHYYNHTGGPFVPSNGQEPIVCYEHFGSLINVQPRDSVLPPYMYT